MLEKLTEDQQAEFDALEVRLKSALRRGALNDAEGILKSICRLFGQHSSDQRLLIAKLWYFECLLDNNHSATAESGFVSISRKASASTLLYMEAIFLEGISLLRQKKIAPAKERIRAAFQKLKNIQSQASRFRHEKRMIERIEQESLVVESIGVYQGELNPKQLHDEAVKLIQTKSEDEILETMGSHLPMPAVQLMLDLRGDAILQLPPSDQKCLPPPTQATQPLNLGKRVVAFVKRVGWRTICDAESPIYQTWSSKLPEMFSVGFFTKALADTFTNWNIQIPILVAGVAAIAMKYSAQDFCDRNKPESIMEIRGKKKD